MEKPMIPELRYFVHKECTPAWQLYNPNIDFYSLTCILSGSAHFQINGRDYAVKQGDALYLPPGSSRRAHTPGMRCVAVEFWVEPAVELALPALFPIPEPEELEWYFQEIEFEWLQQKPGYKMRCQGLFTLVLHRLLYRQASAAANTHVERMKRYLVEHYAQPVTVSELAELVKLHPVYCGALFKRKEGCTIAQYLSRVRINKAASLLGTGEYNVSEVAERTGFQDIYHFSATFKRWTGSSPTAYQHHGGGVPRLSAAGGKHSRQQKM